MKTLAKMSCESRVGRIFSTQSWLDLVWLSPPSPLLWMNGRPGCPVTEILLKRHEWDSCCCLSHHLCQSPGDIKTVCASCPWSVKHTCWIFQVAYLYSLCQLWRGARIFRMSGFFSNFLSLQAPSLRCGLFKTTLHCPSLVFPPFKMKFSGFTSRIRGYCGMNCVDFFSDTTLFQFSENKIAFFCYKNKK